MEIIATYAKDTKAYKNLEKAADILTAISPNGNRYCVKDCYFDLGLNWMWTTIIANTPDGRSYQALCPRDYEKVLTYENILKAVDEIVSDEYWKDKE